MSKIIYTLILLMFIFANSGYPHDFTLRVPLKSESNQEAGISLNPSSPHSLLSNLIKKRTTYRTFIFFLTDSYDISRMEYIESTAKILEELPLIRAVSIRAIGHAEIVKIKRISNPPNNPIVILFFHRKAIAEDINEIQDRFKNSGVHVFTVIWSNSINDLNTVNNVTGSMTSP